MIEKFYLGTYTKRVSEGIYSVLLDTTQKQLLQLTREAVADNPTYLAIFDNQLAAVSKEDDHGGLTIFTITEQGLEKLAHFHDTTAVPCYVAFNNSGEFLLAANYHEGHVSLYNLTQDLHLTNRAQHTGSSVHANQTQPHVHFTDYTPDKQWIITCDLGTDNVITYRQNATGLQEVARYQSATGAGPRHLAFHPTLPVAYLICELNASIEVLHYNAEAGSFTQQEQLLLTTGEQQAWGGAIHVTSDGRFVYATNRGYDRIYAFAVDMENGNLSLIEDYDTFGSVPRDFNFNQTEEFIVIGHQESDNLTLYQRDSNTGRLELLQKDFFAPEVVCVKQAPIH